MNFRNFSNSRKKLIEKKRTDTGKEPGKAHLKKLFCDLKISESASKGERGCRKIKGRRLAIVSFDCFAKSNQPQVSWL